MRRISLITESSARQSEAMPAYQFYQAKQSRWINAVIEYMDAREFPRGDIFLLSHYGQRIIGFEEIVQPYPKQDHHPRKSEADQLAQKTLEFILAMDELPFVEIHTGRTLADPLKQRFNEHGISYRIYGDGVPLGTKPTYYEDLIEDEQNKKRKLKEIQREKWHIMSLVRSQSPQEASEIVTKYDNRAHVFGIEKNIQELKGLLGNYQRKRKEERQALLELENVMKQEDRSGELEGILRTQKSLADLHGDRNFEQIKNKFGKSMAKLTLYLIKRNYAQLMENKISEALLRLQIALIK